MAGMVQDLASVWLDAAAYNHGNWLTAVFEPRGGFHSHHPAFIRVKSANFEEYQTVGVALLRDFAQALRVFFLHWFEKTSWNAVGHHQRVYAPCPKPVFHIAAYCQNRGGVTYAAPVHAMEG